MRIIAGRLKSRIIKMVPVDSTKETSDRIRQAVFNVLGGHIEGTVLDLFSGSGAYALEAISRGASHAYAIDHNKTAYHTILDNAKSLNVLHQMTILHSDAHQYLNTLEPALRFDVVFLDPPYAYEDYITLLDTIKPHLNSGGRIIIEAQKQRLFPDRHSTYEKTFERIYGIKKIVIYTN